MPGPGLPPSNPGAHPATHPPGFLARYPAAAVFIAALVLRAAWALLTRDSLPVDDAAMYLRLGRNLAATGAYAEFGVPTAYMPVGYPFFLSLFFRLFQNPLALIATVQIVLSAATCAMVQVLARREGASLRASVVAGSALAFLPSGISLASVYLVETLFTFLVLSAFILARGLRLTPAAIASGLLLGLACFVRPVALILVPLLFLPDFRAGRARRYLVGTALSGTLLVAVAVPWGLRNQALFGRFVMHSTNGGISLHTGNNPAATGFYMETPDMQRLDSIPSEAVRSRAYADLAVRYMLEHPGAEARLFLKKLRVLLLRDRGPVYDSFVIDPVNRDFGTAARLLAWGNNLYYLILLALFLLIPWWKSDRGQGMLLAAGAAYWFQILFYCVFFAADRYKFPALPFLILVLALGASRLPAPLRAFLEIAGRRLRLT